MREAANREDLGYAINNGLAISVYIVVYSSIVVVSAWKLRGSEHCLFRPWKIECLFVCVCPELEN